MRIAYLDCFSGMSGDMFLGALVDAGVPARLFEETIAALNVGARLDISRVNRSGIRATKVDVYVNGEKELPREQYWEQHAHSHERPHGHDHDHSHHQEPAALREHNFSLTQAVEDVPAKTRSGVPAPHEHAQEHGRGLKEIREIIRKSAISESAKNTAIKIFEALGVDQIVCSPLNVGGGTVKCAHGTFPVPAPATLELLQNAPVYSSGIDVELVTPTGAAIVRTLATLVGSFPAMKVQKIGYGAGTRDFAGHANVVRLSIGESQTEMAANVSHETIAVLEANLDDLNPQVFGYVMDRLLQEGALDVFGIPVQMKKSRPGMLMTLLVKPEDAARLSESILSETTTLGVRRRDESRQVLARKWITVTTKWGDVRLKIASMNGTVTNYEPEYDDCKRIAAAHQVPLKDVMQEAVQHYLRGIVK